MTLSEKMEWLKKTCHQELEKIRSDINKTEESKNNDPLDSFAEESKRLYESIKLLVPKVERGLPYYEKGKNDGLVITVYYVLPDGSERHAKGVIISCGKDYLDIGSSGCEYSKILNRKGQNKIMRVTDSKNGLIYRNKDDSDEMGKFYLDRLSGKL